MKNRLNRLGRIAVIVFVVSILLIIVSRVVMASVLDAGFSDQFEEALYSTFYIVVFTSFFGCALSFIILVVQLLAKSRNANN